LGHPVHVTMVRTVQCTRPPVMKQNALISVNHGVKATDGDSNRIT